LSLRGELVIFTTWLNSEESLASNLLAAIGREITGDDDDFDTLAPDDL
jgi:hypothetical protein